MVKSYYLESISSSWYQVLDTDLCCGA